MDHHSEDDEKIAGSRKSSDPNVDASEKHIITTNSTHASGETSSHPVNPAVEELLAGNFVRDGPAEVASSKVKEFGEEAILARSVSRQDDIPAHSKNYDTTRMIFEMLLPHPAFLDPILGAGPNSPWCKVLRMKKSLTLVCKAWREAALPLLYEDIRLRRPTQLNVLARVLRSDRGPVLAPMIKKVAVECYIPEPWISVSSDEFAFIINYCPNLHDLAVYTPTDGTARTDHLWRDPQDTLHAAFRNNAPRITRYTNMSSSPNTSSLLYTPHFPCVSAGVLEVMTSSLVSLGLNIPAPKVVEEPSLQALALEHLSPYHTGAVLRFPVLTHLSVDVRCGRCRALDVVASWQFPALQSFVVQAERWNIESSQIFKNLQPLFDHCVSTIRSIVMDSSGWCQELLSVVNRCPNLQYLCVTQDNVSEEIMALVAAKPTLQLDVWIFNSYTSGERDLCDLLTDRSGALYPNVRLLDPTLQQHLRTLPQYLEKRAQDKPTDPPILYTSWGISIIQTSWCLCHVEFPWDWEPWDWVKEARYLHSFPECFVEYGTGEHVAYARNVTELNDEDDEVHSRSGSASGGRSTPYDPSDDSDSGVDESDGGTYYSEDDSDTGSRYRPDPEDGSTTEEEETDDEAEDEDDLLHMISTEEEDPDLHALALYPRVAGPVGEEEATAIQAVIAELGSRIGIVEYRE
ncbi:hypothetical protein EIP91_009603 [Steccherinum ochraceum]|uniref:F-box domain-containing protein n=1 Tax=Steccherinum ochraceum TaxID=92696 RepID=A0A4R0R1H0_9APHY|nr:hypothetical protein EIP91_009603 [Steccherinum ochraceum]